MPERGKSSVFVPAELLQSVVAYFQPRRVILFGSQARRDAGVDSDIDLLVELDDDAPVEQLSAKAVQAVRSGYHGAVDIIPCRAGVLKSRARHRLVRSYHFARWGDGL